MDLDIGQIRFFTKVAEKAPRGLRLLLFKEKITNNEKLVFIVKTASDEVEKLALSKMTWVIEQSKATPRVVIVRLMILLEETNDFYKSETGLLMNETKDRSTLMALAKQKSVELYFFTSEPEFHSKVELLTTPNMANSAMKALDANPFVDNSRSLNQSDNISEFDIKNAIKNKSKVHLDSMDLSKSIQNKMPTMSSTGTIKTKSEEAGKVSIKSNDVMNHDITFQSSNKNLNQNIKYAEEIKKKPPETPSGITMEDLMKTIPPESNLKQTIFQSMRKPVDEVKNKDTGSHSSITMEDLMKTVPPESKHGFNFQEKSVSSENVKSSAGLTLNDLKNAISMPPGKISVEDLMKTIPPESKHGFNFQEKPVSSENVKTSAGLTLNDLKNAISMPPGKISVEDLMKTIPPEKMKSSKPAEAGILDSLDFFNNFQSPEQKEQSKKDFATAMANVENTNANITDSVKTEDLFSALSLPAKEFIENKKTEVKNNISNLNSIIPPVNNSKPLTFDEKSSVKTQDLLSLLKTEGGLSDSILDMYNTKKENVDIEKTHPIHEPLKATTDQAKIHIPIKKDELLSSLKNETSPLENKNLLSELMAETSPLLGKKEHLGAVTEQVRTHTPIKKDELLSSLQAEPSPLENKALLSELMSETSPLKTVTGDTTDLAKEIEKNIVFRQAQIQAIEKKQNISTDDLLKALQDE